MKKYLLAFGLGLVATVASAKLKAQSIEQPQWRYRSNSRSNE